MKFGKTLVENQIPEWSRNYMSYKLLKHAVKDIIEANESRLEQVDDKITAFFFQLDRELEKVNSFFLLRKQEAERRMRILNEKLKVNGIVVQSDIAADPVAPSVVDGPDTLRSLLDYSLNIKELVHRCYKFGSLNKQGFYKIMKKYDKKTFKSSKEVVIKSKVDVLLFADEHSMDLLLKDVDLVIVTLEKIMGLFDQQIVATSPVESLHAQELLTFVAKDDHIGLQGVIEGLKSVVTDESLSKHLKKTFYAALTQKSYKSVEYLLKNYPDVMISEGYDERNVLHRLVIGGGSFGNSGAVLTSTSSLLSITKHSDSKSVSFAKNKAPEWIFVRKDDDVSLISFLFANFPAFKNLALKIDTYGRIPLHYATYKGLTAITSALLDLHKLMKNSWGALDCDGNSPLFYAVHNGHTEVVSAILDLISSFPDSPLKDFISKENLLHLACSKGHRDIVELLLVRGIEPDSIDSEGETPLHLASKEGHASCVDLLLNANKLLNNSDIKNASVNIVEKEHGWTPLFFAAVEGHVECTEHLIKAGSFADCMDFAGWTAHDHAVFRGHRKVAELLLPLTLANRTPSMTPATSPTNSSPFVQENSTKFDQGSTVTSGKTYGHHYLQDDFVLIVTTSSFDVRFQKSPLEIHDEKFIAHPAFSILVSASGVTGDPIMIDFPLKEIPSEPIVYYAKSDVPLDNVQLRFDLKPTFGQRGVVLGRGAFILSGLKNVKLNPGSGAYRLSVPLFNEKLSVVGLFNFELLVIKKFSHEKMKIGSKNTYWKSVETKVIGHRGVGANSMGSNNIQIGENTVLSLVTAASLGAEYVEFDVQVTKDGVPVIYHDWPFSESGLSIYLNTVTLDEFKKLGPRLSSPRPRFPRNPTNNLQKSAQKNFSLTDLDLLKLPPSSFDQGPSSRNYLHNGGRSNSAIKDSFATLEELLRDVPSKVGFNVEVKYPSSIECEENNGMNPQELNEFIDSILKCVFEHAGDRSIIFSSFHPEACLFLNLKVCFNYETSDFYSNLIILSSFLLTLESRQHMTYGATLYMLQHGLPSLPIFWGLCLIVTL